MIDLSRSPVKSLEKLARVRGLPRPVEAAHGKELVDATLRGLSLPPGKYPFARTHEPTPSERFAADALWAAAQCLCVGPCFVLTASSVQLPSFSLPCKQGHRWAG